MHGASLHLAYTLVGYDCASGKSNKRRLRKIPTVPERVLDAPFYLDDYCKSFKRFGK